MLSLPSVSTVAVFGDWHGNPFWATAMLDLVAREEAPDLFLSVGDFGVWPEDNSESYGQHYLLQLETLLASLDRELWFVDGNHEHFPYLSSFPLDERGLRELSPHLFHIPRGFAWQLRGKTFVGLGGAYSVDRDHRVKGETWFPEELITEEDFDRTVAHGAADVLLTHEAPMLPRANVGKVDAVSAEQRSFVASAALSLEPAYLVHGHHHTAYMGTLATTQLIGLSCDNRRADENYIILTVDDI